ncbi:MAG: PAS domain S-box-containing protein [Haloarculaceae archaeon]|jgi:PAS domain S-box-containing protein
MSIDNQVLFESVADGLVVHDPTTGEILDVNGHYCELTGYAREELLGSDVELVSPDDPEYNSDRAERVIQRANGNGTVTVEWRTQTKSGEVFPVEVNLSAVDAGDEVVACVRDITDRKRYERRIAALHEATRELMDAETRVEVADIATEAAEELLGFSIPAVWYPTEDGEALTVVANSEEHQRLLEEAGDTDPKHPRGGWFWDVYESGQAQAQSRIPASDLAADVPLQAAILVPLGEHGVLTCSSRGERTFDDQSIRLAEILGRNTRAALDQIERERRLYRYERIIQNLPVGVFRTTPDPDSGFEFCNEEMLDILDAPSREAFSARPVSDFYADPEDRERGVEKLRETGEVRDWEVQLETLEGERIWGSMTAIATTVEGRTYFDGVVEDVTERVEYEKRLQRQRDNLEVLNQVVRHDIRNDMQLVLAWAEQLDAHVDEEGQDAIGQVKASARDAVELTETARALADAMLQEGTGLEPISLRQTLDAQLEELSITHPSAEITVDGEIPAVTVAADEMLHSVFRNLLTNAVQHNDEAVPEVVITAEETDDGVDVRVADNGPGIPADRTDEIFGKGERGLESEGTGIGLYLVNMLVDRYGGQVWVEDNEPEGAVFHVRLPCID